jgi:phosphatidylserine/phosphatidylglycerophosphate/cardiolipin synthase-like enzyme
MTNEEAAIDASKNDGATIDKPAAVDKQATIDKEETVDQKTTTNKPKTRKINTKVLRDIAIIFLIGVIVGSIIVHILYMPTAARLAELEQEYDVLTVELTNKNVTIENLEAEIQSKNMMIDNLTSQISTKQEEIVSLQQQIEALREKIETSNTTISGLEAQIAELNNTIADRNSQIATLEQTITGLRAEITSLKTRPELLGVYFNPQGDCTQQVIYWIGQAKTSIHILAYMLTLNSIGDALVEAYNRGIEIKVVFEESRITPISQYQKLNNTGISVRIDNNPKAMNDRVMIVDGSIILTGSFTWNLDGQDFNDENLIILRSSSVANLYEQEFQRIWDMSKT